MKHLFVKGSVFLLTMSTVVACGDNSIMEEASISNQTSIKRISITGNNFQKTDDLRSSVNIAESGVSFLWSANDTVGIFPNNGNQVAFAMENGIGAQTATFDGGGWGLKASAQYAAYYPYNFYNRDMTNIPVSYAGQIQTGNSNTNHIGGYDYMVGSLTTPANGTVAFNMQHLGCLIMLKADLGETATLTKATIKCDAIEDPFTSAGYIDLTAFIPQITATSKSNRLNVNLNNLEVLSDETTTIYFMMAPINLIGHPLTISLSTNAGEDFHFQVSGKDFVAGKAYAYILTNGEKAKTIPEYAIDLGLPSGTLWADRNVGADSPDSYGDYFAWGETEAKDYYYSGSYKWGSSINKYNSVDRKTSLVEEDDAATINMGAEWRMPTPSELSELLSKCTRTATTLNGTKGLQLTGPNGNSIFLPYAGERSDGSHINTNWGYYWSNEVYSTSSDYKTVAKHYEIKTSYTQYGGSRYTGRSVRAVVR